MKSLKAVRPVSTVVSGLLVSVMAAMIAVIAACPIAIASTQLNSESHFGAQVSVHASALASVPVKLVLAGQFGGEGTGPGEFEFPEGVAGAPAGVSGENDVYVADQGNHRVQEFTSSGKFVLDVWVGSRLYNRWEICKAEESRNQQWYAG